MLLLLSCASVGPAPVQPAVPVVNARVFQKPVARWLVPLAVLEENSFPSNSCGQRFVVKGDEMVWQIDFPVGVAASAVLELRRTNDLSAIRADAEIVFRIRPGNLAPLLRAGLVDGKGTVVAVAASKAEATPDSGWITVELPLATFPDGGAQPGAVLFDWSSVKEFRLICSDPMPQRHVEIAMLRIVKE